MITKLDDVLALAKSRGKKRLVAAYANDSHTIGAVSAAIDAGIVDATLVGDIDTIKKVCAEEGIDVNKFELVQEADETKAGVKAVKNLREFRLEDVSGVKAGDVLNNLGVNRSGTLRINNTGTGGGTNGRSGGSMNSMGAMPMGGMPGGR